jgi:hypothetical protein
MKKRGRSVVTSFFWLVYHVINIEGLRLMGLDRGFKIELIMNSSQEWTRTSQLVFLHYGFDSIKAKLLITALKC